MRCIVLLNVTEAGLYAYNVQCFSCNSDGYIQSIENENCTHYAFQYLFYRQSTKIVLLLVNLFRVILCHLITRPIFIREVMLLLRKRRNSRH